MGEVRIIGGQWKRSKLPVPDLPGLRPTSDRVRETLFNWLGQTLDGWRVLDAFAGSGALGFEAASRGARRVVMVERDATSVRALKEACDALEAPQVEVVRADALEFVQRARSQYDVIFLDPPFADAPWDVLFQRLPAHLAGDGLVYCESGAPLHPPAGWAVHRQGRAGQVHYALLKPTAHEPHSGIPGHV